MVCISIQKVIRTVSLINSNRSLYRVNMASIITAQAAVSYCEKHSSEEIDMYCRRCKIPACTTCLREEHNDHEFDTIVKYSRQLTNNRAQFLKELTAKYERKRKPKSRKFREVKCRNEHVLSVKVKSLEERREQLHRIVDELIDKEVNTCQSHNAKLKEDLENKESKHNENDDKIQNMLTTFEKTTMTGLDIIEFYDKLNLLVDTMETELDLGSYCDRQAYLGGEVSRTELQKNGRRGDFSGEGIRIC